MWKRALVIVLLVVPPLLLHAGHLAPEKIPYLRDLSQTHLPFKKIAVEEMRHGRLPLWNPLHDGGSPLFANPNFFHVHPVTLLYLVLPFPIAFSWGLALLSVLGAIGTALWLRALGYSTVAAATGGIAFALGGLGASSANLYNLLASYAALPWALWALARLVERRRLGGWLAAAAIALGSTLAGGEPTAFAWALVISVGLTVSRKRLMPVVGLHAAAAALALGLVAVQLLPAQEFVAATVRGAEFTLKGSGYHSVAPARLVEMVWPGYYGDPTVSWTAAYRGLALTEAGGPLFYSLYVGVSVLALALLGLFRSGGRRWFLVGIAVVALVLALGRYTPVFALLWQVLTPLHFFRYPVKLLLPFYLVIAVLAARGFDLLVDRFPKRRAVLLLVPVLVAVDLLAAHSRLVPGVDAARLLDPPPIATSLAGRRTYFWRGVRFVPNETEPERLYTAYHQAAYPPHGLSYGLAYMFDADVATLDLKRSVALGRVVHQSHRGRERLLPMAAVERIISPVALEGGWLEEITPPSGPESVHVYEVTNPIPYARVVSAANTRSVAGMREALELIADPAFDARRMVLLEGTVAAGAGAVGTARVSRPSLDEIEVIAEGEGTLVIAESYSSDFVATVDDVTVDILPANVKFMAVPLVGEGVHRVRLTYAPEVVRTGATLSLLSLAVVALLLASGLRRVPGDDVTASGSVTSRS